MLEIEVPEKEFFIEANSSFITTKRTVLQLEHSLISLKKWESKYNKAFLTKTDKTSEETMYYIKCMTINKQVDDLVYYALSEEDIIRINDYIQAPMTATTFHNQEKTRNNETVTAELIYYWMVALNIPFECEKWHLNQLLTLIQVCNIKNTPPKKMSKSSLAKRNAALNAARRKKYNTRG